MRVEAADRLFRRAPKGTELRWKAQQRAVQEGVLAIRDVLLALWELGFPWPPDHAPGQLRCACRMCIQAYAVALGAYRSRRFVDSSLVALAGQQA